MVVVWIDCGLPLTYNINYTLSFYSKLYKHYELYIQTLCADYIAKYTNNVNYIMNRTNTANYIANHTNTVNYIANYINTANCIEKYTNTVVAIITKYNYYFDLLIFEN